MSEKEKDQNGSNGGSGDQGDAWGTSSASYKPEVLASMPTHISSFYYNTSHLRRGYALIFNHETFSVGDLKARTGTNVDCESLTNALTTLNFQVEVFKDYPQQDLYDTVEKFAKMDHSEEDCILLAILSHGESGIIYAYDRQYKLESLWTMFTADRCPTLAGKPKLFFIQACQGDRLDSGVTLVGGRTETDGSPSVQTYRIPTHADFLIAYSTVPGFYSWRNTTRGSWFIQSLCEELRINGRRYDLMTILTLVSRRVATDYESNVPNDPAMHRQKQIPCITTMLTRLLRFDN